MQVHLFCNSLNIILGSSKHGRDEKCISPSLILAATFTVIFGKRDLLAMAAHPVLPAAFPKTLPSRPIEFSGWLEKLKMLPFTKPQPRLDILNLKAPLLIQSDSPKKTHLTGCED